MTYQKTKMKGLFFRKIAYVILKKKKTKKRGAARGCKAGDFVVPNIDDGEIRSFIIKFDYLAHPGLVKLVDQFEEEFGFGHMEVLAVPFCTE